MPEPLIFREYQPTHMFDGNTTPDPWADYDQVLADMIYQKLAFHYGGHFWSVEVDSKAGIAKFHIMGFSSNYPVAIKLKTLASDPGMKCVVRYAGDYLERLNLSRSGFNSADLSGALHKWGGPLNRKLMPGGERKRKPALQVDWRQIRDRYEADKAAGRPIPA